MEKIRLIEQDLKHCRKMVRAAFKIIDIIHNSRITKEFAIETLKKSKVDEEVIDFIRETWQ